MKYGVCIIGSGPAGISAAIYSVRAGVKTAVISAGAGVLDTAEVIENYYGFEKISGRELNERGINQAKRLGVDIFEAEATSIEYDSSFAVIAGDMRIECGAVILALGRRRQKSGIKGIDALEGRGVSFCAVCDGFFYRGKDVGVLGNGAYAVSEAKHLSAFANSVTIFTNGQVLEVEAPSDFKIESRPILSVLTKSDASGQSVLGGLELEDGEHKEIDGLFIALGMASAGDFALKLGVITENGIIKTDADGQTNVPGLFAAGDCTGGIYQVSQAVGQGAAAGLAAAKFSKKSKK